MTSYQKLKKKLQEANALLAMLSHKAENLIRLETIGGDPETIENLRKNIAEIIGKTESIEYSKRVRGIK